jgi:hypothetical protein
VEESSAGREVVGVAEQPVRATSETNLETW